MLYILYPQLGTNSIIGCVMLGRNRLRHVVVILTHNIYIYIYIYTAICGLNSYATQLREHQLYILLSVYIYIYMEKDRGLHKVFLFCYLVVATEGQPCADHKGLRSCPHFDTNKKISSKDNN